MRRPLVSVVIPTYNRAQMVGRAIRSVLRQTHPDLEVVVVDDGSTDDTASTVQSITDHRLRYIELGGNRGHAAARNAGIAASHAHYVAFLDSDDEWDPEKVSREFDVIGRCGVSVTGRRTINEYGQIVKVTPQLVSGDAFRATIRLEWVPATSTLTVRANLLEADQFDETLNALVDLDLMIRLTQRTTISAISDPLVTMHQHAGERVRLPENAPELWNQLIEKYRHLIPYRARGRYHYRAFLAAHEIGAFSVARRELWRALRHDPMINTRAWLRLASMLGGQQLHAALRR